MAVDAVFETALRQAAEALGVPLSTESVEGMHAHFVRLIETNASFNLTRITEPAAAAVKLYADSLAPLAWLAEEKEIVVRTVLDVGTGAGFPAVPIALARPAWCVTALDSTGKKAAFVARSAEEIPIANLAVEHARAGEWKSRQRFDLVLFKAVGDLARCLSFLPNSVAPGGCVAIYKGRGLTREELDAGQARAESMGMQTWDCADYDLPLGDETLEHTLVVYRKTQH